MKKIVFFLTFGILVSLSLLPLSANALGIAYQYPASRYCLSSNDLLENEIIFQDSNKVEFRSFNGETALYLQYFEPGEGFLKKAYWGTPKEALNSYKERGMRILCTQFSFLYRDSYLIVFYAPKK